MSVALSEFWSRLVRAGIVDAADCRRLANEFANANGTPASDSTTLAQWLVDTKALTAFQSQAILAPTAPEIRVGDFVQRSDQTKVPLGYWMPVQTVGDRNTGFLIRTGPGQIGDQQIALLQAHASTSSQSLQPFQVTGNAASGLAIFSALPAGNCLSELTIKKKKVDKRQALTIGIELAGALQTMHDANLVHGSVRADRVWITSDGQPVLLRDPSAAPARPRDDQSAAWLDVKESPGWYAAPELAEPNTTCTALTDIYSLGCLMFRMVVGRMPFDGATVDQQMAAHATEVPTELATAIEKGEAGDPILRVVAYAMAKAPAARFASAQQLASALQAVVNIVDSKAASTSQVSRPLTSKSSTTMSKPVAKQEPPKPAAKTSTEAQPPKPPTKEATPPPIETPTPKSVASTTPPPMTNSASVVSGEANQKALQPTTPKPPKESQATNKRKTLPKETGTASIPVEPPPQRTAPPKSPEPAPVQPESKTAPPPPEPVQPPSADVTPPAAPPQHVSRDAETHGAETTNQAEPPRRRRRRKKSKAPLILGAMCVPVLILLIALISGGIGGTSTADKKKKTRPPIPKIIPKVPSSTRPVKSNAPDQSVAPAGYQLVSDASVLWVPPFAADTPPAPLDLLPPGPGVIVSARFASLQTGINKQIVDALSPELSGLLEMVSQRAKLPPNTIERCTIALHAGRAGSPVASLAIVLTEPITVESAIARWGVFASNTQDGATIYAGDEPDGDVFYLGDSEKGKLANDATFKRFAVGSLQQIKEVAANEGGIIPLPRFAEKLWKSSSSESDIVALITPNFLFADGRNLLLNSAPELIEPLNAALIPDVASMLLTAKSNGDMMFTELRAIPSGNVTVPLLLRSISDRIKSVPQWAELFNADSSPDPSWKLLAGRMPAMMRFLVRNTRYGTSDDMVVANAYLPGNAAAQISLATLLAMNTKPGSVAVATTNTPPPAKPMTIEEILGQKITLDFGQETVEHGIGMVGDELSNVLPKPNVVPKITLVFEDLRKSGITQNKSVSNYKQENQPFRKALTDLLVMGNPDASSGPMDPKQSLVWVLTKNESVPGGYEILITSREAASGVHELPAEFGAPAQ